MKALNETPTAELIAEVANIKLNWKLTPESERGKTRFLPCLQARFEEIAAELDRRCAKIRLQIAHGKTYIERDLLGKFGTGDGQINVNAAELHALLGWLLTRDGK